MPATCGSTALLRELRERQENQKGKEQVPLKMRSKTQAAKAKILAETDTMTQEAEASEKAAGALKQASKSCGKRNSKHQAAHAEAQAVPSRGLQDATQTNTPALAEPCSDQASAPPHGKTAVSSHPQKHKSGLPASPLTLLSMPPQQESIHPAPAGDKTAAASDRRRCSVAPQGNAAAHAIPASTAAAAEVTGTTASSAQQVAPMPAASSAPPQQPASASAAAPAGAPEQEQADPRTAALQMLVNAGVKKEEGALALAAVPENPKDAEGWAMTAIEWLTTQMELRDEIHDIDRAMQVSLQEAEQQKQAQRSPLEMPEEEFLAHFKGSVLIPKLKECACGEAILNPPLKAPIVDLLELEQKACRWYSTAGTKAFFLSLGEQCKEAALQAGHPPEGASCKKQRVSSPADEQHSTGDKDIRANPAFCAFLNTKARELQHGLYQMPETSGEVPAIFMPVDGALEDREVTAGEQAAEELVLDGDAIVLD